MSKGKGEIRQKIKNGISETSADKTKIRRNRKKEHNHNLNNVKFYFGILAILILLLSGTLYMGFQYYQYYQINLVRLPINLPKIVNESEIDRLTYWGTYRPQLFFGMKSRSKFSILTGLMWYTQPGRIQRPDIRYWCKNDGGIKNFGWNIHDWRRIGEQTIQDIYQKVQTSFVKNSNNWVARINVKSLNENVPTSLIYYLYLPESVRGYVKPNIDNGQITYLQGSTLEIDEFRMKFDIDIDARIKRKPQLSYLISHVPREDKILQTVEAGLGYRESERLIGLIGNAALPRSVSENIWAFQLTGYGNFTLDISFESTGEKSDPTKEDEPISRDTFQSYFSKYAREFRASFGRTFQITESQGWTNQQMELAQTVLSQLVGGIGYFHGQSLVRSPWSKSNGDEVEQPMEYWSASLLTGTPSRTMFPRGFLWDEGFHTLLLSRWRPLLALDIIGHWLDLVNAEGWIPREQILGWEARAKVPTEFIIQDGRNGNPPTLVLSLQDIDNRYDSLDTETQIKYKVFLMKAIPRLEAWFQWFNTTQIGEGYANYRWKGRNMDNKGHLNPLTLTSGLDDYPRASHPNLQERHVDLRCWMAQFAAVLSSLCERVPGRTRLPVGHYAAWARELADEALLDASHWDTARGLYADWGLHSEAVQLRPVSSAEPGFEPEWRRTEPQPPQLGFVPHTGYVSFFPLLLRVLRPESVHLEALLTELERPSGGVWTRYGLRSLAPSSRMYRSANSRHDPPYWRGAIWLNVNVLAVRALAHYSEAGNARAGRLLRQLRANLVGNVLGQLHRTGYLWEQYDDVSGTGQRAHPFSGWTALVVLAMADGATDTSRTSP